MSFPLNVLVWNIRGVSQPNSSRYLMNIFSSNDVHLLVLIEPIISASQLDSFRLKFKFDQATSFLEGRIWFFWKNFMTCSFSILANQLVHAQIGLPSSLEVTCSALYAKHTRVGRRPLWDEISTLAASMGVL